MAVDGEGARDVGGEALVLRARVNQEQVAVSEFGVVVDVVEYGRVRAAAPNLSFARSTPARRPVQVSFSLSRGRTKSVYRSSREGATTATASGSEKPVR